MFWLRNKENNFDYPDLTGGLGRQLYNLLNGLLWVLYCVPDKTTSIAVKPVIKLL